MPSKKEKQTKLNSKSKDKEDSFILDMKKEIKPKRTQEDETKFILDTMKLQKKRLDEEKKDLEKEKKKLEKEKKEHHEEIHHHIKEKEEEKKKTEKKLEKEIVKHIDDVEHDIKKNIEFRKIVPAAEARKGIRKTADLFGQGFHYFIDLEEKFTHDFIFGYLPDKIKKYIVFLIILQI